MSFKKNEEQMEDEGKTEQTLVHTHTSAGTHEEMWPKWIQNIQAQA